MAIQEVKALTIANGQAISSAYASEFMSAFGVQIPDAFTGASISFQASADGVNFKPLYDSLGALVSITVVQGRCYDLPTSLAVWRAWKIVSASNEAGARTLNVAGKTP